MDRVEKDKYVLSAGGPSGRESAKGVLAGSPARQRTTTHMHKAIFAPGSRHV
ncbi:MAG: hypothetical protein ABWX69_02305 [Arthrobacter sp.]